MGKAKFLKLCLLFFGLLWSTNGSSAGGGFSSTQPYTEIVQRADNNLTAASVPVTFASAQTQGNTNVIVLGITSTTITISSITDTAGNTYTLGVGPTNSTSYRQWIYYAKNIKKHAANNVVTVAMSGSAWADIRAMEYSGIDGSNPVNVTNTATGNSLTPSISITTTAPKTILVTGGFYGSFPMNCAAPDVHSLFSLGGNTAIHRVVNAAGTYTHSCNQGVSAEWIFQTIAFRTTKPPNLSKIAHVQSASVRMTSATPNVAFGSNNAAGNMIAAIISFASITGTVTSVTDTRGNTYSLAVGPTTSSNYRQYIFYAPNTSAGANTVTANLSASFAADLRIAEYSGLSTISPLDKTASNTATGSAIATTPTVLTNYNDELIVAGFHANNTNVGTGDEFTLRQSTSFKANLMDRVIYKRGDYRATSKPASSQPWILQMATFQTGTCSAGAFLYNGYCYYLGAATETCYSKCSTLGGCIWAGTDDGGSNSTKCNAILGGLGVSVGSSGGSTAYTYACAGNGTSSRTNTANILCGAAAPAGWQRACACGAGGTTVAGAARVDNYNYRLGGAAATCTTTCASYGGCVVAGLTNAMSSGAKCDEILSKLDANYNGTASGTTAVGCGFNGSSQRYMGSSFTCAGTVAGVQPVCACTNP